MDVLTDAIYTECLLNAKLKKKKHALLTTPDFHHYFGVCVVTLDTAGGLLITAMAGKSENREALPHTPLAF